MRIAPGGLKLIAAWSAVRDLDGALGGVLLAHVRGEDVRRLFPGTYLVYTAATCAELRDMVAGVLWNGESVFAVEFERWSSGGPTADRAWLLFRGH